MQCPSCKSASPDNVRFCLHCGQYFGEPDETTWVPPPRTPPPTTIRANPAILSKQSQSNSSSYAPPSRRRWPIIIALSLLDVCVRSCLCRRASRIHCSLGHSALRRRRDSGGLSHRRGFLNLLFYKRKKFLQVFK